MASKSILIPDDLAERSTQGRLRSRLIRDVAVELAQKLQLEVELLYVKDLAPSFFKKKQIHALLDTYADIETSILKQFEKAKIKGRVKIISGPPVEKILEHVEVSEKTELIVMGTHGKKGLEKMFLGSVAEEVLRNTNTPVLILGPMAQEKQTPFKIDKNFKILLLSDLSESSTDAENFTLKLCKELQCKATLIYSVGEQIRKTRDNLYGSGYIPFDMEEMFSDMTKDSQRSLSKRARQWEREGVFAKAEVTTKEESLQKTIQSKIRQGYNLIIMGTHKNKLAAFIGSNARKIIQSSPVPVIVVRSKS